MITLLLGPEEGQKNDFLNQEIKKLKAEYPDAESYLFFGGENEGEALSNALLSPSLFSSFTIGVVKHYENATKTDSLSQAIASYAKEDPKGTALFILSSSTDTKGLPKGVAERAKSSTYKFWELKDYEKRNWIRGYARKYGYQITDGAITEILLSVDNNTNEMKNLISSIISFLHTEKNNGPITEETIELFSSKTRGEDGNTLFEAVAERNLERSLLILSQMLLKDSTSAVPAFAILASSFRTAESCLALKKEGLSEKEIFSEVETFPLYAGSAPRKGIFFKSQGTYSKAMSNYSLEEIKAIILLIGKEDSTIKGSAGELGRLNLETILYTIIVNGGRSCDLKLSPPELSLSFRN